MKYKKSVFATLIFFLFAIIAIDAKADFSEMVFCEEKIYKEKGFLIATSKDKLLPKVKNTIKWIAKQIKNCNASITIAGHANKTNTPNESIQSSLKRAEIVKEMLINYGVSSHNIKDVYPMGELNLPFPKVPKSKDNKTVVIRIVSVEKPQPPKGLTFTTANSGNTYIIGNILANMWNTVLMDRVKIFPISSESSVENIKRLEKQKVELAIVSGLSLENHIHKKGKTSQIRLIAPLWPNVYHFIVLSDKVKWENVGDIENVEKFCIETTTKKLLDILKIKKIHANKCGTPENTVMGLRERRYEGAAMCGGLPMPTIADLFTHSRSFSILGLSDNQIKAILEKKNNSSILISYNIPAKTYPRQEKRIKTIGEINFLVVHESVASKIVYLLTKAFFYKLEELKISNSCFKEIDLNKATQYLNDLIPLHNGAKDFYKEKLGRIPYGQ